MTRYRIHHETRAGCCHWCWEPLSDSRSPTVVRAAAPPTLELRFHHRCWASYRGLSGIEGRELRALYREWSPQRVEALRLHAGLSLLNLARRRCTTVQRLTAYLAGQTQGLSSRATARLRNLAVD